MQKWYELFDAVHEKKAKQKKTKTKKRQTNKHAQGYYNMNTEQMVALSCLIGVGI